MTPLSDEEYNYEDNQIILIMLKLLESFLLKNPQELDELISLSNKHQLYLFSIINRILQIG